MNKLLQRIFLALAIALAIFSVLETQLLTYYHLPILVAKTFWGSVFGALFLAVAAFKLGRDGKFRVFMLMLTFLLLELALQAATWTGLLPGVNTELRCPYARVYWTAEGRGNSIRNGFGWYYPAFDLKAPRRIAAIGDSQVEAVEVGRTRNSAYQLQELLKHDSPDWSVLGLGAYGTAPAYHIEVLEYAQKHFKPTEAIIYISLGSDIRECLPALNGSPPANYIYYDVDEHDHLVMNPGSAGHRAGALRSFELSDQPCWVWLPTFLSSHCMTVQSIVSMRDALRRRQLQAARAAEAAGAGSKDFRELGFSPAPFAINQSPEVQHAMMLLKRELERCKEICDGYGIRMRVVTIPVFPSVFYDTQKGRDWTTKIGEYDYSGPERELVAWAAEKNIPLLPLGERIQAKKLDVQEIRSYYFSHGTGHLTEQGHRFCANAVYEAFYQPKQP